MIAALITKSPDAPVNSIEWCHRSTTEKLYPTTTWQFHMIANKAVTIEHPFMQKIIDLGAHVTIMQGEWTVMMYSSLVMLQVYRDFINIECIATPVEFRGEGSGTNSMKALVMVSDETGIPLRLRACNVTGGAWNMLPQHVVVAAGMKKPKKIPVRKLPDWYKKFGFELVGNVYHQGKPQGYNMRYIPSIELVLPPPSYLPNDWTKELFTDGWRYFTDDGSPATYDCVINEWEKLPRWERAEMHAAEKYKNF